MAKREKFDIAVVGAGPAGLGFARALEGSGISVCIIEGLSEAVLAAPPEDGRDIALTHTSEKLMRDLGIWEKIDESRIGTIRDAKVMNGASPYALQFEAKAAGAEYLGRILPNDAIRRASFEAVDGQENVMLIAGQQVENARILPGHGEFDLSDGRCIEAKLLIAADSRFSTIRRKLGLAADSLDFGRTVIVCEMSHTEPHDDTAFECFHYDQTLAILPMVGNVSSVVVTLPTTRAEEVMNLSDEDFAAEIEQRFEGRLGKMTLVSPRHPYPLVAVLARKFVAPRIALVGDAAVGMHPVTAHGYNLGLSGGTLLAEALVRAKKRGMDLGDLTVLKEYEAAHRRVVLPLYHGTNAIVRLFTDTRPPARFLRDAALRLGNILPPVRNRILNKLTEIEGHAKAKST
ncbi:MAG: hypothetical protein CR993_06630 [Rhodobacterales bacterium]|nr:MAG: hypothetical protein CR993_06630 [Rhodobacterales bacterium]